MRDPASFRPADLSAVWGPFPYCVVTLKPVIEMHHILGRGQNFGSPHLNSEKRSVFSSVFNSVPLAQDVHAGPARDQMELRRYFLRLARSKAFQAAARGTYDVTELDRQFLEIADEWLRSTSL